MSTRTVYVPRLIESAEQAEALPEGTVLIREEHFAFQKHAGQFVSADPHDLPTGAAWEVVGWTALVPVEAEEEFSDKVVSAVANELRHRILPDSLEGVVREVLSARHLVTPWEEA
ncbi:hypothetical protein [Brachybacterium sp.]|uniref:hypothetical protein n=1 Tax=Brachybacterium sp. TaxID=1891286 RepID=UPI002ED45BDE